MVSPNAHVILLIFSTFFSFAAHGRPLLGDDGKEYSPTNGTRWAVLVAGSNGYENYRHQADVCHAYQILRRGGLNDENIIVFMYDDIAFNYYNPRPGIIINRPDGEDVYAGVPQDYTGENCTADNLLAVILGNKSALTGGSGKVLDSGPDDRIFLYYADHGASGLVGMPSGDYLYAKDLIQALKKKHEAKAYRSMVIYLEACESGSMFEGLLPSNLSIYAITAANAEESSWATYCPGDYISPPPEFGTCLGDIFSISWMEDSDLHDSSKETVGRQYQVIKRRTGYDNGEADSHVMQFGDKELISKDLLSVYMGKPLDNRNFRAYSPNPRRPLTQHQASLLFFRQKYKEAPKGSHEEIEAFRKFRNVLHRIKRVERSMDQIAATLLGQQDAERMLHLSRPPAGKPLVDDWDCFKMLVRTYEERCGRLSWYGGKYARAIANMCNAGVTVDQMRAASTRACFNNTTSLLHV